MKQRPRHKTKTPQRSLTLTEANTLGDAIKVIADLLTASGIAFTRFDAQLMPKKRGAKVPRWIALTFTVGSHSEEELRAWFAECASHLLAERYHLRLLFS